MSTTRRTFLTGSFAVLAAPLAVGAQPPGRIYRIGWLGLLSPSPEVSKLHAAFRAGLRELGYLEGRDYALEFRWAHGRAEALPALAAELVGMPVDVIVGVTSQTAHAAKNATTTIPILLITPDPLSSGLVTSLARPDGNITGVTMFAGQEFVGKYVDLIKQAVPSISRLGLLWSQSSPWQSTMVPHAEQAARTLGLKLQPVGFVGPADLEAAFGTIVGQRSDAVVILPDANTFAHRKRLVHLAAQQRLPAFFTHVESAVDGGLMAFAANTEALFRRAATYVDRLIKGARPGELPIEQPTKFELVVNLKTAKALGLTIPPSLRLRADQVIE